MKRTLLILSFLFSFTFQSYSTETAWLIGMDVGPEGSLGLTPLGILRIDGFSNHAGLSFGFQKGDKFNFGIYSGLSYMEKVGEGNYRVSDLIGRNPRGSFRDKMKYLIIPVTAQLSYGKPLGLYFEVGVYYGFLLDHYALIDNLEPISLKQQTAKNDLGLNCGGGLNLIIKEDFIISAGLKANIGVINVYNDPDIRMRTFSSHMSAGVKYKF